MGANRGGSRRRSPMGAAARGNRASRGGVRSKAKSRDLASQRGGGGKAVRGRTSMAMDDHYRAARDTIMVHRLALGDWAATVDLCNGNGRRRVADGTRAAWTTEGIARHKAVEALQAIYFREPHTARIAGPWAGGALDRSGSG